MLSNGGLLPELSIGVVVEELISFLNLFILVKNVLFYFPMS
jgi:hypothetical protein